MKKRKREKDEKAKKLDWRKPTDFFAFSLSLLHLIIALPLAYFLNIWSDEASTLYTTENGLAATFHNVFADEKQAPLYFLLLSAWREISHSIFFARFFSIVCSLLAITIFYRLARRLFDEKTAFWIAAFFALHPFLIWASLEIRVYSLVILFSVGLLKLFFDGYLSAEKEFSGKDARAPNKAQIGYVLISIIALYTNYYLGFLLVGNFIALLILRRGRAAKRYFLQMLIVGAAFLPLLWIIKMQFATAASDVPTPGTLAEGLRLIWNSGLNFILPTELFPPEEITTVSFTRVWLVRSAILVGAVLLFKKRRELNPNIFAFGAISAVTAAFLLLAYFLLGEIYVEIRHAAVLFAPLILFSGLVVKIIFPQRRGGAEQTEAEKERSGEEEKRNSARSARFFPFSLPIIILLSTLLILFVYSISTLYPQMAKRGDWARVAAFIEEREKPDQPIIVFTVFDALNLPYHYRGVNRILPDERFFNWGSEGEYGAADSIRKENDFVISKIPPEAREIWLATGERCQTTKACAPLEKFVEANYTIIEEKNFYKERVRLLRKK